MKRTNWAVFTDLDGTLIDFETYSAELSAPSLRELQGAGVPVVFCSSKTRGEQQALLDSLELSLPCIVENGSGLYLPKGLPSEMLGDAAPGSIISWGISAGEIRAILRVVSKEMGVDFGMYCDLDDEDLMTITGLGREGARRARDRDFSETLTAGLHDEQWVELGDLLAEYGLRCQCGGRFYTVTSMACDKGRALGTTLEWLGQRCGGRWKSMALGDSANDVDMLNAADVACVVQRPDGDWNDLAVKGLRRIRGIGPVGWNLAVEELLKSDIGDSCFRSILRSDQS